MLDRFISYSFYLLFFLVPLFWTSKNYELFEYNKMLLTYSFTVLIVGAWMLKMIRDGAFLFKTTPLDIPLLLFLGANVLSTLFSIDSHTSIWGYYSRSNGGLLSIISYLLLYWAYVANMDRAKVLNTLKFGLVSGMIISVWGILEHFGVSPSCIILRQEFSADCWIQDVQDRVFATLGQPNWMAAYLAMLIFPAVYFLLTAGTTRQRLVYYLSTLTMYLAFTFTYSRGPTLGLIGGLVIFLSISIYFYLFPIKKFIETIRNSVEIRRIFIVLIGFVIINFLFGSALTNFRLVSKFAAPLRPAISLAPQTGGTQLENGGTESGQIRFIVWRGALDIFKNYPLFGSGVETFAYSYYQFRPKEHNLTSEWDFLYNKAHNEYLNYLATTGIVGLGSYSIIIITVIIFIIRALRELQSTSILRKRRPENLLLLSLLASYISYLIYNFFLFSVVIIAIFFYLFPALAFVGTGSVQIAKFPPIFNWIYRRPLYTNTAKGLIVLSTLYLLYSIFQLWYADTLFAKGQRASEAGNPGRAYNYLTIASELNKKESFYISEKGYAAAAASSALAETEATLSAVLKEEAILETERVLKINPKNVSFWRTAVRTYSQLAMFDETVKALDQAIALAPTDPKLYYNKALVLDALGKQEERVKSLQKAIELKPNYLEALSELKEATTSAEQ